MSEDKKELVLSEENKKHIEKEHEDAEIAFKAPAIYSNKCYVTFSMNVARLSFVEVTPGGEVLPRTAVTMTYNDLVSLKDVLTEMSSSLQMVKLGPAKEDA